MTTKKTILQTAQDYIAHGLSIHPTQADKRPDFRHVPTWQVYQETVIPADQVERLFSSAVGIGVISGPVSGDLEVIDVDTKNSASKTLWADFNQLLLDNLEPAVYKSLPIETTKSGGKHIFYRCSAISSSVKTAKGADGRGIIEIRGNGYVQATPSPGYSMDQGSLTEIPQITPDQRDIIISAVMSFNEITEVEGPERQKYTRQKPGTGLTPWDDYDENGDIIGLLEKHGWSYVSAKGNRIYVLRGGGSTSKTSGNWCTKQKLLYLFSSSTEFKAGEGYTASAAFALLECGNDFSLSARRLREAGYGDPQSGYQAPTQVEIKTIQVTSVNSGTSISTIISEQGKTLKVETAAGDTIDITSPGPDSSAEVLAVIAMYEGTGKRIYINEPDQEKDLRSWGYKLLQLLNTYNSQEITARTVDNLIQDAVKIGSQLRGTDRTLYNKMLCSAVDLTPKDLEKAEDKLAETRAEEAAAAKLKKATDKAADLLSEGKTTQAAKVLQEAAQAAQHSTQGIDFSLLFESTTEQAVKDEEFAQPDSIDSGYTINGEQLLLPAGAISVFAAATGHGKTLALINTVLNVSQSNPDKQYIFFTYEERAASIIQYFLNAYINIDLNKSSKTNRRIYKHFFKTGETSFISEENKPAFSQGKKDFFKTFIESGRILIKYINYDADQLNAAIHYVSKESKVAAVFIDYFQLLSQPTANSRQYNNRQEELKQICLTLKDTANITGLPVVLAAQFNREVTNLERLHPTNIGEAGDIERIVNTLVGIWSMPKKNKVAAITLTETNAIMEKITLANKGRKEKVSIEKGMYMEILKSRDLQSGGWEIFDYNGNTGRITNGEKIVHSNHPTPTKSNNNE